MKHWPDIMLLANGSADALALLAARYDQRPDAVLKPLAGARLGPETVRRLAAVGLADTPLAHALEPFSTRALGWAAQLELTVRNCADFARHHDCPLLLIKGAANARLLYPAIELRLGNDVDVVMASADIERLWPGAISEARERGRADDHLDRTAIAGLPVEIHYRWGIEGWGSDRDLFADSAVCPDHPELRLPTPATALTLTLTHIHKHRGAMPFDWIDLALLLRRNPQWDTLTTLWSNPPLAHRVHPALVAADAIGLPVPRETLRSVGGIVTHQQRAVSRAMVRLFLARRWRRLQRERVEALVAERSLIAHCWPQLAGSAGATERLTGLRPGMPGFRRQHYLVLPLKRILRTVRGTGH